MKNTLKKIGSDAMDILRIWSSDRTNCYALGKVKKNIIFLKILLGSYDRNLRQCWGSGRVCSLHFSCSPGPLRRWNYLGYIIMLLRLPFHPYDLISFHVYFLNRICQIFTCADIKCCLALVWAGRYGGHSVAHCLVQGGCHENWRQSWILRIP